MNYQLAVKGFVITGLALVILIAVYMVNGVIGDRDAYRQEAVKSIEASYAGAQTVIGPVLVRPFTETVTRMDEDEKGRKKTVVTTNALSAISFPRVLKVGGRLAPSEKRHGLYRVTVYEFGGQLSGSYELDRPKTEGVVAWGEPYLAMSVSDVRGIVGTPAVMVNGTREAMAQGAPKTLAWVPNLRVPLNGVKELNGHVEFSVEMRLAGTEQFGVAPVGDSNEVAIRSSWASPLFEGQFLPQASKLGSDGFDASWEVSSLASATQTQMNQEPEKTLDLMKVTLLTPIDAYKLSDRATKYGILFVLLTFGGFFLFEILKALPIHPVQYLLVGFALAVFFLLLVSFSEHMPFGAAYLIASAACIGLLAFYLSYVLRSVGRGVGFGALLTAMYGALYGLLISEDNALILGSVMLFAVLAAVMVLTRKVDWYGAKASGENALSGYAVPPPMPPS